MILASLVNVFDRLGSSSTLGSASSLQLAHLAAARDEQGFSNTP